MDAIPSRVRNDKGKNDRIKRRRASKLYSASSVRNQRIERLRQDAWNNVFNQAVLLYFSINYVISIMQGIAYFFLRVKILLFI